MTNTEKIIALLSKNPGLDDDELSSHTNIRPRQQVNQICRRLESNGVLRRTTGPQGKVVNFLIGTFTEKTGKQLPFIPNTSPTGNGHRAKVEKRLSVKSDVHRAKIASPIDIEEVNSLDREKTLILIPCSGKKSKIGRGAETVMAEAPSFVDALPSDLRDALLAARSSLATKASLDESTLIPAWKRYTGTLYEFAEPALRHAAALESKIAIISGGYGLLFAGEPIGTYDLAFKASNWPKSLLEEAMISCINCLGVENVVAFVSRTTGYRRLLDKVDWSKSVVRNVFLVMPKASTGAMRKAPKAQGEALSAFLDGSLRSNWRSSDDLGLLVERRA